ncbi:hypothetical protein V9T40_005707 [Parthenolecanium corni]|uniref:Uncharacterized protein n=1 Tax=Parthenolecanium corni TaxID=536013 RepID=A0AAN9Y9W3_9HEMI
MPGKMGDHLNKFEAGLRGDRLLQPILRPVSPSTLAAIPQNSIIFGSHQSGGNFRNSSSKNRHQFADDTSLINVVTNLSQHTHVIYAKPLPYAISKNQTKTMKNCVDQNGHATDIENMSHYRQQIHHKP